MTICIAAIYGRETDATEIAFAADRLATDQNGLTFELGISKITRITDDYFIMSAGNSSRASLVLQEAINQIFIDSAKDPQKLSGYAIAQTISEKCKEVQDKIIQKIFDKKGVSRKEFFSNMKQFPDWFQILTTMEINNFDLGVHFILFGFDIVNQEKKIFVPRVYEILDNGEINIANSGFSMIGIGYSQSVSEITKEPYDQRISRSEAVLKVYLAKKSAQRMQGVGETTDLGYIKVVEMPEDNKKLYTEIFYAVDSFKEKIDDKIKEQTSKMKEFENDLKHKMDTGFTEAPETK